MSAIAALMDTWLYLILPPRGEGRAMEMRDLARPAFLAN